jgi:hypothetical protein
LGTDGFNWLRKEPRALRPYEPAIEALMLQLAREVKLPAAEGAACEWVEAGQYKRGIVVRSFVDRAREQLASGTELLSRHDASYEPEAKWQHTVQRVRDVLAQQESQGAQDLMLDFARMLAFDAWIGNGDRHQDNWSVIISEGSGVCRLAPMYDPAACLGTELQDGNIQLDPRRRTDEALRRYIARCPSGFGDGKRAVTLMQVVDTLKEWPEWGTHAASWLAAFRNGLNTVKALLPSVDSSWLPDHRKTFITTVLEHRLFWLERLA